ncbi:MAG: periplasmic heavy metal sensor [Betaproteobacteria bacterium]
MDSPNSTPRKTRRRALRTVATLAAMLTLSVAGTALAQPMRPGGGAESLVAHALQEAKGQLNLNTSQQLAWDNAVADTKAAHQAGRTNRARVRDTLTAELAKAEPNLAAVAAVSDEVQQQNRAQHVQIRSEWLNLYATFSPEQKAVVKDQLSKRMSRLQQFREKMQERFQQRRGPGAAG